MQFSDTSTKQGLIQECEFWTNLGDAVISGDTTLLKQFTNRINRAFDKVLPIIISKDDTLLWDDPNYTDHPIARTDLVSGQQDYTALTDEDGNSILNVVKAFVLQSATATEYVALNRVPVGMGGENRILNPATTFTGIPSEYVERGSTLFLGPIPNYNATNGLKIMFERVQSYFASTDTTKKPGIPAPFHQLLALHASKDWLTVNKPDNRVLIAELKEEIAKAEKHLASQAAARNPKRKRVMGQNVRSV